MKRFLIAVVLTFVLCSYALGGDIPSVGIPAPASSGATESTSPGLIPTDGMSERVSGDALSAILSVLSFVIR